jgi:hypothetical protein
MTREWEMMKNMVEKLRETNVSLYLARIEAMINVFLFRTGANHTNQTSI